MQMLLLRELEKGETFASLLNIHTGSEPRYTTIINCIRLPILYSAEYRDVLEISCRSDTSSFSFFSSGKKILV
jgi:hypothetical protein